MCYNRRLNELGDVALACIPPLKTISLKALKSLFKFLMATHLYFLCFLSSVDENLRFIWVLCCWQFQSLNFICIHLFSPFSQRKIYHWEAMKSQKVVAMMKLMKMTLTWMKRRPRWVLHSKVRETVREFLWKKKTRAIYVSLYFLCLSKRSLFKKLQFKEKRSSNFFT